MGIYLFSSSCVHDTPTDPPTDGNPNKFRYRIGKSYHASNVSHPVAVELFYPDCKNYGGRKILVYRSLKDFDMTIKNGHVDPHFLEGQISPVARFEPTDEGWTLACNFTEVLSQLKN
jgi:hypothetical protein